MSILVPGCGLGRLVFDYALKGYKTIGNEFSYFCLLSSNFVLNSTEKAEQFKIYPFIHNFDNLKSEDDAFKEILVPDVCPSEAMTGDISQYDMAMSQGEFIDVFGRKKNDWDCIVTCFFIDTAHNFFDYLKTINEILKKGGLWVNIGPLQWHYTD